MDDQYKLEHEAFVQNLTGSSLLETSLILNIIPVSVLFQRVLFGTFFPRRTQRVPTIIRFFLEFLTIILPFIVSVTYIELLVPLILLMLLSCFILPLFSQESVKLFNFGESPELLIALNHPRKKFIEEYRSFVMIATIVCILAVDFPVFPRRLSKTETFGISLMDIGVGSVVLSGAMVSRQARSESLEVGTTGGDKEKEKEKKSKQLSRLGLAKHAFMSNLPLMLLGLIRIVLTKSTNYQEHVTEYGIHWNFFFTLGFVAIFLSFLKMSPNMNLIVGSALIIGYQVLLSNYGLSDYILNHPRLNLISANKEGICSLAGYLSLYLIGTKLGTTIFKQRKSVREWRLYVVQLLALSVALFTILYWVEENVQPISRRMTNLPYVLSILALNIFNFAIVLLVSTISSSYLQHGGVITSSINRNQLSMFLMANILTGLVNFSMRTIYATPETSMAVIISYVFVVCFVSLLLNIKNITLKLT